MKLFGRQGFLWLLPMGFALWLCLRLVNSIYGLPIDDAYIYLRYVQNLKAGLGFGFNPGEISFGVTSFLYTILCVILSQLLPGVDPLHLLQWVGIFWFLVLIYLSQQFVYESTRNWILSLACGFLLAWCRPLFFTAPAGLETSMFLAWMVFLFHLMIHRPDTNSVWLGFASAILFLIRPEGLLIAAGYGAFSLYYLYHYYSPTHGQQLRRDLYGLGYYAAGFIIPIFPYSVFVKIHTGYWMPSTFYGKLLHRNYFLSYPWNAKLREGFRTLLEGWQEIINQDPTPFFFSFMLVLTGVALVIFIYECGKKTPSIRKFSALGMFFSLLFLPFLFGYKFNIFPKFGGYFVRYLQPVIVVFHLQAACALDALIRTGMKYLPTDAARKIGLTVISVLISMVVVRETIHTCLTRLDKDLTFYQLHTQTNEGVRKQAALWLRDHTPADARILIGTTGLGSTGMYCGRYVKDEGGLINPDIYPFLKKYLLGFNHWESMLEYMKQNHLSYYTAYFALDENNRYTTLVNQISDPTLMNTQLQHLSTIRIYQFHPLEKYDLWADYSRYATFIDRARKPIVEKRVKTTLWNEIPTLAVDAREVVSEIQYRLLFPKNPKFTAGIALDYPQRTYTADEWIQFDVSVEYDKQKSLLFSKRYSINQFTPRASLESITVDLKKFSERYATVILSVSISPKKQPTVFWAGWVQPNLINKSQ